MTQPAIPLLTRRTLAGLALAAAVVAPAPAQERVDLKGVILNHVGPLMVLNTAEGEKRVRLQDTTKVESLAGAPGGRRERRLPSDLVAGLQIEVSGAQEGDVLVARSITFRSSDLKTAKPPRP